MANLKKLLTAINVYLRKLLFFSAALWLLKALVVSNVSRLWGTSNTFRVVQRQAGVSTENPLLFSVLRRSGGSLQRCSCALLVWNALCELQSPLGSSDWYCCKFCSRLECQELLEDIQWATQHNFLQNRCVFDVQCRIVGAFFQPLTLYEVVILFLWQEHYIKTLN